MRRFRFAQTLAVHTKGGRLTVWVAAGFGDRLLGLAALDSLPPGRGLLIPACSAVHTWGMRFRLDIAFLDWPPGPETAAVLRLDRDVPPRRLLRLTGRRARRTAVLEAPAGTLAALGLRAPGVASTAVTFKR